MTCPKCKSRMRCVDSRPDERGRIRRYRCPMCGKGLWTVEKILTLTEVKIMTMTKEEIARSYRQAKTPSKQIRILAELNQCDRKAIIKILQDAGCKLPGNCVPKSAPKTRSRGVPLAGPEKRPEPVEEKKLEKLPGAKHDDGKLQLSRVPPELITAVATIRAYGIAKYAKAEDWTKVDPKRFHEALLRHALSVWENPKAVDPESGYPSLWHLATNVAFLIAMEERHESSKP